MLQEFFARGIYQSKHSVRVKGEQRSIDFFHHAPQKRSRFNGADALIREQIGQGVDFKRKLPDRVTGGRSAGSKGIVFLAQRRNHVRQCLQRTHDLLVQCRGQRPPDQ